MTMRIKDHAPDRRSREHRAGRPARLDRLAVLFGGPKSGRWRVAPQERVIRSTCRYRDGTLILDTTLDTQAGNVVLTDWMVRGVADPVLMRRLR